MRSAFRSSSCRVMAKSCLVGCVPVRLVPTKGSCPFCPSSVKAEAPSLPGKAAATAAGASPCMKRRRALSMTSLLGSCGLFLLIGNCGGMGDPPSRGVDAERTGGNGLPLVNPLYATLVAPDLEDECGGTSLPIQFEQ